MNKRYKRNNIQAAVWLIGIGILLYTGYWWPGILILAGISMLVKTMTRPVLPMPPHVQRDDFSKPEEKDDFELPVSLPVPEENEVGTGDNVDLLPEHCPSCGGPVESGKVRWQGDRANCLFCGVNLLSGIDK